VLKPNEAMIEQASGLGSRIGLLATFAPTLRTMPPEFPKTVQVVPRLVAKALDALNAGDGDLHDNLIAGAASELTECDVIALSQFSMARAARIVEEVTDIPVLTTPGCAVLKLRDLLTTKP
jgi:hypothetical protein